MVNLKIACNKCEFFNLKILKKQAEYHLKVAKKMKNSASISQYVEQTRASLLPGS